MRECPVCSSHQFRCKKLIASVKIEICSDCGFLISDIKRPELIRPEFSWINDKAYKQSTGKVRRHQALEILQFVRQFTKTKGDWLDIGCSFGYLLFEAKEAEFNVFGVDPDETAVEHARALVGESAVQREIMSDETRPDNSADIISTLDVLEHIPANALSNFAWTVHRKLRANGLWIIKVPSTEGLYFTIAHQLLPLGRSLISGVIKRLWQSDYEYPHTVYFNLRTLKQFLKNHAYEPIGFKYLEEVPNSTVKDRLLMDSTIPKWQALLLTPLFCVINFIEKLRGKSDALLVVACRKPGSPVI